MCKNENIALLFIQWKNKHSELFPTSANAKEHVLLALGSDCTGRDDVKISRGGGQSACSHRFICVKRD